MEANLGRASYSLWTNLARRKSGISKVTLDGSKDQVSHTWVFGQCVTIATHIYYHGLWYYL